MIVLGCKWCKRPIGRLLEDPENPNAAFVVDEPCKQDDFGNLYCKRCVSNSDLLQSLFTK